MRDRRGERAEKRENEESESEIQNKRENG